MKSALTVEQRVEWQKLLSNALIKEKNGFSLSETDLKLLDWHTKYVDLMKEKLKILEEIKS